MSSALHHNIGAATRRRPTKVTLDRDYLDTAHELGIDVSQACERGLAGAIAAERATRWIETHREMLESYVDYVGNYELPVTKLRRL